MANGEGWQRIGALWKSKKGMTGTIQLVKGGEEYHIWMGKNRYKKPNSNQPDAHVFLMPENKKPEPRQPEYNPPPAQQYPEPPPPEDDEIPF